MPVYPGALVFSVPDSNRGTSWILGIEYFAVTQRNLIIAFCCGCAIACLGTVIVLNARVGSLVDRLALEAILPGELPTMVLFAWVGGPYMTLAIVTALNCIFYSVSALGVIHLHKLMRSRSL
jgi:hypothetical protein